MISLKKISSLFFISCLLFNTIFTETVRDFSELFKQSTMSPQTKNRLKSPCSSCIYPENDPTAVYVLSIKTEQKCSDAISWRAYFQGQILTSKQKTFNFTAPKNITEIPFLIALIAPPKKLDFKNLSLSPQSDYLYYILKKEPLSSQTKKQYWKIKRQKKCPHLIIPKNAFILFLSPSSIKTLEGQIWNIKDSIIALPTIVLKKSPQLEKNSIRTVLSALDVDSFHGRSYYETIKEDQSSLSKVIQT